MTATDGYTNPEPAVESSSTLATVRSVFSLLLSYGLLLLANGLFGTLLGVRSQIEGFGTEVVGLIMAAYFLGLLQGALRATMIVAAVGHIRAFAAFASVMSITALLHVVVVDPIVWCVLRFASGFCMAGMILVTESWLNARSTKRTRGKVMALYMITNYFSAGCGQFLLTVADPGQFQLFSIASIIFSLALVPVLLTRSTAPKPPQRDPLNLRQLWRTSPLGLLGSFCAGLVNASFYSLAPVFAFGLGLSIGGTSTFMASVIFGGLLLQYPVGHLSDRIDRRVVLTMVALATSVACVAIVLVTEWNPRWIYPAGAIYGAFSFTVYSLCISHANDFAPADKLVQTASGLLTAYGFGAFLGPIIAAFFMGRLGPEGLFVMSALVSGFLGGFAIFRMRRRLSPSKEKRSRIITMPGGQFTSGEMYASMRNAMDRDLASMSGARRR
ncbi:MAG: MFS transporter [Gammaproteobacteria bacterium]|nr:MAG: MFS transporter [Gammaproteobacteria bacterium]